MSPLYYKAAILPKNTRPVIFFLLKNHRISILDGRGNEVETVRIGDRLTFRISIPDRTPYGIFARSCVAMAKDSRSTFPIIDADGCPVDPTIFPRFTPEDAALVSKYEAFRWVFGSSAESTAF